MNQVKHWVLALIAVINRYPWTVALFGFVSGLASFFMVERNEQFAQAIAVFMLISWAWLILENVLARGVAHWFGLTLPPPLLKFATQLVHQESLFFAIPFFVVTTVWNSGQAIFSGLLIVAAFISIIDPLYYRWLAPRRWLYFIFHGLTLFAVLLIALPILFQLPTGKSYQWALAIAVILSFPSAARGLDMRWWKHLIAILVLVLAASALGLLVRTWIPPATLWLAEVAITDHLDAANNLGASAPRNSLTQVTAAQLRQGLYAYTAIHAPRGLKERIYHVWLRNGREVDRVALDISGGREAGYRAWSHKLNFPDQPAGNWKINVVTEANQLIGVLRFRVVEGSTAIVELDEAIAPVIDAAGALNDIDEQIPVGLAPPAEHKASVSSTPAIPQVETDENLP
jgi:hypothetical protein